MAIEVYCNCGSALSVSPALGGKKVRCKACGDVLQIPTVPMDESAEAPAPAPRKETSPSDYEVVSEEVTSVICPGCGATASSEDTACLACGEELSSGALGSLSKVPRPVLFGGVALVGVLLLGFVGHWVWTATRPGSHASSGLALLNRGDLKEAEREFKLALGYAADHPEATIGLALVGVERTDSGLIRRYAPPAIDLIRDDRERARVRLAYAWLLLEEKDVLRARNQAIDARAEDPTAEGPVHAIIGLAALQAGQAEEALTELEAADQARFEDVRVYRELARLKRDRGMDVEARTAAEKAVKLAPEDAPLWLLLADLRGATGDAAGVEQALARVIELEPKNPGAHRRLSQVHLDAGQLAAALKSAERAAELDPQGQEAQLAVGRILLAQGEPQRARKQLEKAQGLGSSWEAEFLLGKAEALTGDATAGMRRIQGALTKRREDVDLHLEAARIALESGQAAPGAVILERLVADTPKNYDARVLLAEALARREHGRQRHDADIRRHLQAALDLDGKRREAPLALGLHLFESLQPEPAIEVFAQGLEHNPQDMELLYYKGWAAMRARRWDEAIEALEACAARNLGFRDVKVKLQEAKEGRFYDQNRGW